jgi:hypothetical protein
MIRLETTLREAILAQNILADVRLERIFDMTVEQQASNSWVLNPHFAFDDEMIELTEDIRNVLIQSGLREFDLEIQFC